MIERDEAFVALCVWCTRRNSDLCRGSWHWVVFIDGRSFVEGIRRQRRVRSDAYNDGARRNGIGTGDHAEYRYQNLDGHWKRTGVHLSLGPSEEG